MARPKYDPHEKKVPKCFANIIESLIEHETLFLEKGALNIGVSRYAKETGLYNYKKDQDKRQISRKQDFVVSRRSSHHVFFKVL